MTAVAPRRGPGRAGPGRSAGAVGLVTFVLALGAALSTPLMGLPDEPAHAVHAVAVVRGEVVGEDAVRTHETTGWTRTETTVEVPAAYAALPELPTCFAFQADVAATCAPPVAGEPGPPAPAVTTVGTYAPPWYALVGWPSLVLDPAVALHVMRVVAALVFAALLAVAAVAVQRVGAGAWGLLGLAAGVPPVAVHLAGGINPSGTEVAAGVALWATSAAVAVVRSPSRGDVVRWVVAGVAVALVRPLGPVLVVGIPVASFLVLQGRPRALAGRTPGLWWAVGTVGGAALASLGWSAWRGTLSAFSGFPAPELGVVEVLRRSSGLVPERLVEMVGVVGWSDVGLHPGLVLGWLVVVAGVVFAALPRGTSAGRWWLLALAAAVLVLPVLADLRSAPQIGFVWQGRYTLPIAAGLPVLGGVLVGRSRDRVRWRPAVGLAAGVLATVHAGFLLLAVRRFAVGTSGSITAAVDRGTAAGVPYALVLVVVGVALVGAVAGLVMAERDGPARGVTGEVPTSG